MCLIIERENGNFGVKIYFKTRFSHDNNTQSNASYSQESFGQFG